ncbi:hypothetical protein [Novosphingobium sp. ST904]|uniref:hypothetical protein n=1 Tax=Novosphingobium sp. ST904 TaxID=1684385 RepID=UPI001042DCD9|nr:hypothetical protein [Novosphingobium sp. ST904]TCM25693.1 hypothetical protein EDF59_1395 [Novosphingobium sp. ST904]
MSWTNALRGAGGQIELNRVVGFIGGMAYIAGAHVFIAWDMLAHQREFDLAGYCTLFPAGLAIVAGGTAVAVAVKDRNVATARSIDKASGATMAEQGV